MGSPGRIGLVALDVGGTKVAGAVVSYAIEQAVEAGGVYVLSAAEPRVEHYRSTATLPERGGDAVLQTVISHARQIAQRAECPLVGAGVGAAGVIDPATGAVRFANDIMPGWTGQPLEERLRAELGVEAAALGDVHAHALGEARWGAAKGAHSCLCVGVGTGLGGAFVFEGAVMRGFHGAAGHIGHTLHPAAAGIACTCASSAHVETVSSGTAIAARFQGRAIGQALDPARMGDVVAARAEQGDAECIEVLEWAGRNLGEALGGWCNVFDPELVVLSGTVVQAGDAWWRALEAGFRSQVLQPLSDVPLVRGALGGNAPVVGAAENVLDKLVKAGAVVRSKAS